MELENGAGLQPAAEVPVDNSNLSLVTVDDAKIITHLPPNIVNSIVSQVGRVKLATESAQEVVRCYETALGPSVDDEGNPIPSVEDIFHQIRSIAVTDSSQKTEMAEAHRLRMLLVKRRVKIDELRKEMKEDAKNRSDFVDGCGRGIRLTMEDAEAYAKYQADFRNREIEQQRKERYEARQAALRPYMVVGTPEPLGLADMDDKAFQDLLEAARGQHFARIARSRYEELAKWDYDGEAEFLGTLSEEGFATLLANTKVAYEIAQEEIKRREQKKIERMKQLSEIGLRYAAVANAFAYDEMSISDVDIQTLDDIAFAGLITRYGAEIKVREEEKQKVALAEKASEDRRIARIQRLSAIGMTYNGSRYVYEDLDFSNYNIDAEDDAAFESDFAIIAPEIERRKKAKADADAAAEAIRIENERKAKEQAEAEAKKAAEEKRLRLAPDKEKLTAYGMALLNVEVPSLVSDEAKAILESFKASFNAAVTRMGEATNALAQDSDVPF